MLLLLLYYHPLHTALLNIWKHHFNGWVESRLTWGRQNNCAGIAHKGENFVKLCMMLSHHSNFSFFFFFEAQESCLLFCSRLRKRGSWCGAKENSCMSFPVKEHTIGWENVTQLSVVSNTNRHHRHNVYSTQRYHLGVCCTKQQRTQLNGPGFIKTVVWKHPESPTVWVWAFQKCI